MRSSTQRNDAYTAGYVPTTVGLKVAARLAGMKSGFASIADSIVPIEVAIQTLLNANAVPTIQYPFYLCFGRELWALGHNGIEGAAADLMAQSSHDKWVARGLATARLIEIADSVFNLTVT